MEVSTRKPYFIEEEEVSSPSSYYKKMNNNNYYYNQYSVSSPRSVDFRFENSSCFGQQQQQQPHFLDSCFRCKKRLADNRDIFMYRGDTPFCSEECREEQIERDETKEKKKSLSSSVKEAMSRNEKRRSSSSSPTRRSSYAFQTTGTVAAA